VTVDDHRCKCGDPNCGPGFEAPAAPLPSADALRAALAALDADVEIRPRPDGEPRDEAAYLAGYLCAMTGMWESALAAAAEQTNDYRGGYVAAHGCCPHDVIAAMTFQAFVLQAQVLQAQQVVDALRYLPVAHSALDIAGWALAAAAEISHHERAPDPARVVGLEHALGRALAGLNDRLAMVRQVAIIDAAHNAGEAAGD
jgi:hypothetical protein